MHARELHSSSNIGLTPVFVFVVRWIQAWGEDGFFKIKQGNCGIESQVFAGHPAL